ncbi:MAG TPA: GspH/FimT family pseudopilin [Nitrospirota bacterium]|nr:GspH/FimT family pseudopilin [Nitrospirota bacterium]
MKLENRTIIRSTKGYTLIELIFVIVLIAIMAALAVPYYMNWINNTDYRSAARHVASVLRQARSNAIATNKEQQVILQPVNNVYSYGTIASSLSSNTVSWPTITIWNALPLPPNAVPGPIETVQFTPNGLISTASCTIPINDSAGNAHYQVAVSSTGRITISGPLAY